jgi:uncharacterized protein YbaA (DUF1428 family)
MNAVTSFAPLTGIKPDRREVTNCLEGIVAVVPATDKQACCKPVAAARFEEFGAGPTVEAWGDDVSDGKAAGFEGAVKARRDEVIVFSWQEYSTKEETDKANKEVAALPGRRSSSGRVKSTNNAGVHRMRERGRPQ